MLIVFEGNFGLGKSTQINNVSNWIETALDMNVVVSEWNSNPEIRSLYMHIEKNKGLRHPLLYIYFQLLDFVYRYDFEILPALKNGSLVICDRYYYTILARADVRNLNLTPLQSISSIFASPDYIFYLDGAADLTRSRVSVRGKMRNEVWSVGINNSLDPMAQDDTAYLDHLKRNLESYRKLMQKDDVIRLDANCPITELTETIKMSIQKGFDEHGYKTKGIVDCI